MKRFALALALGAFSLSLLPGAAAARGVIETACNKSPRPQATRALCACIQKVAGTTLSAADQRRGAGFFTNPHLSQEVRASAAPADDQFWANWEHFAATAVRKCQ